MGNVILQSETMKPSMNLLLNVESVGLTPDQFYRLCSDNPELRLELTARKEIVIMPPACSESGARNLKVTTQLVKRSKKAGEVLVSTSLPDFTFPNAAFG